MHASDAFSAPPPQAYSSGVPARPTFQDLRRGHDSTQMSQASTPSTSHRQVTWKHTAEAFVIANGAPHAILARGTMVPVLEDRLYLMTCSNIEMTPSSTTHYFTMDKVMRYQPFCADHGPFNLGMTHKFCGVLLDLMTSKQLRNSKIVYYTSPSEADTTNAMYLLGAFMVLHLHTTPEEAMRPFECLHTHILPYRDATWVPRCVNLY